MSVMRVVFHIHKELKIQVNDLKLLELNSRPIVVFNLRHDGVGVKRLCFLLHTVFWKQVCTGKGAQMRHN